MSCFLKIGGSMVALSQKVTVVPGGARDSQIEPPQTKVINLNPYFWHETWLIPVLSPVV